MEKIQLKIVFMRARPAERTHKIHKHYLKGFTMKTRFSLITCVTFILFVSSSLLFAEVNTAESAGALTQVPTLPVKVTEQGSVIYNSQTKKEKSSKLLRHNQSDIQNIGKIILAIKYGWEHGDGAPFREYFLNVNGGRYIESGGQNKGLDNLISHHV